MNIWEAAQIRSKEDLDAYVADKKARQTGWMGGVKKWLFGDNSQRDAALKDPMLAQLEGGNYLRGYAQNQLDGAQGRQAPTAQAAQLGNIQLGQASQLAGGPQDQWRQQQMGLAGQLSNVASGQQMGAGEMAVRRQANQQAAQIAGQTAAARGSNAGIMARAAARSMGDLGVNAAGAASQSALQDQAAARNALGGLLAQGRGADIDIASQNAQLAQQRMLQQGGMDQQTMLQQGGFNQQAALANQAAALQQRGMNDQYGLGLMGAYQNVSNAELQARLARLGLLPQDSGMFPHLLAAGGQILAGKK